MRIALLFCILLVGCDYEPSKPTFIRENFVRLFMNEPGKYSILVNKNDELITVGIGKYIGSSSDVRIYTDVKEDESMYYISNFTSSRGHYDIELHIHSEKDINGGGWNHGKFGKGTTEVVE